MLEKTLESPLNCKEIKPVNLKENQPWIFIGRTDAEASILWPPDVKSRFIEKDPDAGKIEGRRRRGWQRLRWVDGITDLMDVSLSKLRETVKDGKAWRAIVHGVAKSGTLLSDWTTTIKPLSVRRTFIVTSCQCPINPHSYPTGKQYSDFFPL